MTRDLTPTEELLTHTSDKFLYFFLGLRKGEIRRRANGLKASHPDESPEQLARRLITAQTPLSILGGMLLQIPMFVPTIGPAIKILGIAGGTTVMIRMHMALILEIAYLFDRDIDDIARLKEMGAVLAATGLASTTPVLSRALSLKPYMALVTGGMTVSGISQLIGETAIRYYSLKEEGPAALAAPEVVPTHRVGEKVPT